MKNPTDYITQKREAIKRNIVDGFTIEKAGKVYQIGEVSAQTGLKKVGPGKWVDPRTGKETEPDKGKGAKGAKPEAGATQKPASTMTPARKQYVVDALHEGKSAEYVLSKLKGYGADEGHILEEIQKVRSAAPGDSLDDPFNHAKMAAGHYEQKWKELQDEIDDLASSSDPDLQEIAKLKQGEADKYSDLNEKWKKKKIEHHDPKKHGDWNSNMTNPEETSKYIEDHNLAEGFGDIKKRRSADDKVDRKENPKKKASKKGKAKTGEQKRAEIWSDAKKISKKVKEQTAEHDKLSKKAKKK